MTQEMFDNLKTIKDENGYTNIWLELFPDQSGHIKTCPDVVLGSFVSEAEMLDKISKLALTKQTEPDSITE